MSSLTPVREEEEAGAGKGLCVEVRLKEISRSTAARDIYLLICFSFFTLFVKKRKYAYNTEYWTLCAAHI